MQVRTRKLIGRVAGVAAAAALAVGIWAPASRAEKVPGSEGPGAPKITDFVEMCDLAAGDFHYERPGVFECSFVHDADSDWVIVCSLIKDKCWSEIRPSEAIAEDDSWTHDSIVARAVEVTFEAAVSAETAGADADNNADNDADETTVAGFGAARVEIGSDAPTGRRPTTAGGADDHGSAALRASDNVGAGLGQGNADAGVESENTSSTAGAADGSRPRGVTDKGVVADRTDSPETEVSARTRSVLESDCEDHGSVQRPSFSGPGEICWHPGGTIEHCYPECRHDTRELAPRSR